MTYEIVCGDSVEVLRSLPDASIDSVVTDPPYGLGREPTPAELAAIVRAWILGEAHEIKGRGFMGKSWDAFVPAPEVWRECLRVLKPGGHLVAFAGTRTQDLMGLALRLAGFEIRDCLQWIYGTGFPKSLDVSKAIDGHLGSAREVIGPGKYAARGRVNRLGIYGDAPASETETETETAPGSPEAAQWAGWGTALKPAYEPILLCRKPLEGTVATNALAHGTGGINVDGCRIESGARPLVQFSGEKPNTEEYRFGGSRAVGETELGRWPANVILDEPAGALLDAQAGDRGGASRFFYCAKAARSERERGLDDLPIRTGGELTDREDDSAGLESPRAGAGRSGGRRNVHPTVKPVALMRWLVRLVTPPGGLVLDPFAGSGTTGIAAIAEGFGFGGIEREAEYVEIAQRRLADAARVREALS